MARLIHAWGLAIRLHLHWIYNSLPFCLSAHIPSVSFFDDIIASSCAHIYFKSQPRCRPLRWEEPVAHFKQRLANGEDVFGELLDKYIINNQHRVTIVTLPDASLGKKIEEGEKARLLEARSQMTAAEVCSHLFSCPLIQAMSCMQTPVC